MKRLFLAASVFALLGPATVYAQSKDELSERIAKLEEEIKILKRLNEVDKEEKVAKAEKTPSVEYGKKGLLITSPDKQYSLKLSGYAQIDGRFFLNDDNNDDVDTFLARRLRPILEAKVGNDFSFRLMPDFAGSSTRIFDAHADYAFKPYLKFRAGKFKTPVGLERLQSASDIEFVERGLPTNLVPTRDFGVQLYGEILPETLEYQLGVFNGNEDLGNTDTDVDDKKDVAARIFAHPFRHSDVLALQGLGLGVSGSYGAREGTATNTILPEYRTPAQARMFRYRTGAAVGATTFANGDHWRFSPQGYYYYNSLGLLAEYVISSEDVTRGASSANLDNHAWQVEVSYLLTGEDASAKGVKPANSFDPKAGGWGAFELVGRYGELDVDNAAFPFFADPSVSISKARSWGTGINWYFNENSKLVLNYENTWFDGGAVGGGDRETERVILTRAQVKF